MRTRIFSNICVGRTLTMLLALALLGELSGGLMAQNSVTDPLLSNPNLEYFAVYSTVDGSTNLPQVLPFGNLVWIQDTPSTGASNIQAQLQEVQQAGKKAIVDFNWAWTSGTYPSDFLTNYVGIYTPYEDTIVAFEPLDEPFSNSKITNGSQLATMITQVKAVFPNWKAVVVFSADEISGGLINNGTAQPNTIPPGYDWVGVDCYDGTTSSFGGCGSAGLTIPDYLAALSEMPNSPNKFVVVPSGFLSDPSTSNQEDLEVDEDQYMEYALGEQNVVAIFPFEFENFTQTSGSYTGIQGIPLVQQNIENWGATISRANSYYPLKSAQSDNVLSGWPASNAIDGSPWTAYSSGILPSSANSNGTTLYAWMDLTSTPFTVQNIALTASTINGVPYGFPQSYDIAVTTPENSDWVYQGTYTTQPDLNGTATIQLPNAVSTYGVQITPRVLGMNLSGNYDFQIAEIGVQGPLGTAYPIPMTSATATSVLSGWPASNAIDGPSVCCYSSGIYSSSANPNGDYFAAWTDLTAAPFTAQNLVLTARMLNGVPQAFPQSYFIQVSAPDNSSWIPLGTYTNQPNSAGVVTIPLPQNPSGAPSEFGVTYGKTYGVMITPKVLGVDSNNNHYFQLAQVGFTGYY
jgi:hypothetical protein